MDGSNIYGATGRDFEGIGSVYRTESAKIMFLQGNFSFSCSDAFAVGCII